MRSSADIKLSTLPFVIPFLVSILYSNLVLSGDIFSDLEWSLLKEESGTKVYSAKVDNSSHKAVLSEAILDADLNTLIALIRDPKTCKKWVYRCQNSYLHQSVGDREDYIYTVTNMPYPVKDRDILAQVKWEQDLDTLVVKATGQATKNILPDQKGKTRITMAIMQWELTPLGANQVLVRNFVHADPGGSLPVWLSNNIAIEVPIKTMKRLQRLLRDYEPVVAANFISIN